MKHSKPPFFFSSQGVGVGLRPAYYSEFLAKKPAGIDWVEALTENYLRWENGFLPNSALKLEAVRQNLPVALHGVSLSIGSADPLAASYLARLKELIERIAPLWVSDHLCWTGVHGKNTHDLLPFPYTVAFLKHVVAKVQKVQDYLQRPILLENVSSYVDFTNSEMTEWDFISAVSTQSGCGILLDINNIYVSAMNHGFDPEVYLAAIPPDRVGQIHLAGHRQTEFLIIDTHDAAVCDPVWELYKKWTARHGSVSTMIERDANFPEWKVLQNEALIIRQIQKNAHDEKNKNNQKKSKQTPGPAPEKARSHSALANPVL